MSFDATLPQPIREYIKAMHHPDWIRASILQSVMAGNETLTTLASTWSSPAITVTPRRSSDWLAEYRCGAEMGSVLVISDQANNRRDKLPRWFFIAPLGDLVMHCLRSLFEHEERCRYELAEAGVWLTTPACPGNYFREPDGTLHITLEAIHKLGARYYAAPQQVWWEGSQ